MDRYKKIEDVIPNLKDLSLFRLNLINQYSTSWVNLVQAVSDALIKDYHREVGSIAFSIDMKDVPSSVLGFMLHELRGILDNKGYPVEYISSTYEDEDKDGEQDNVEVQSTKAKVCINFL